VEFQISAAAPLRVPATGTSRQFGAGDGLIDSVSPAGGRRIEAP
jgi:hypothetical protein